MPCDTEQEKGSNWHKLQCASFLLLELLLALQCHLSFTQTLQEFWVFTDHKEKKVSGLTLVIPVVHLLILCLNQEKQIASAQGCGPGNFTQNKIAKLTKQFNCSQPNISPAPLCGFSCHCRAVFCLFLSPVIECIHSLRGRSNGTQRVWHTIHALWSSQPSTRAELTLEL